MPISSNAQIRTKSDACLFHRFPVLLVQDLCMTSDEKCTIAKLMTKGLYLVKQIIIVSVVNSVALFRWFLRSRSCTQTTFVCYATLT